MTHTMLPNVPPDSCEFLCPQQSILTVTWTKYLKWDTNSGISTPLGRLAQCLWPGICQKCCICELQPALTHIPLPSEVIDNVSFFLLINRQVLVHFITTLLVIMINPNNIYTKICLRIGFGGEEEILKWY